MAQVLLSITLVVYLAGVLLYFAGNRTDHAKLLGMASISALMGCILNLWILIHRWSLTGRLPLASGSEFLLCFSFFTVLMYLVYEYKSQDKKTGAMIMLIASFFILLILVLMADQLNQIYPLMPALKSPWLSVHVLTAVFSYAAFALAAGLAARNIIRNDYTQHGGKIYLLVAGGFAMLSLSIIIGAVWAEQVWGSYWSWDPKETWALITWIVYALFLHLHKNRKWQRKRSNIIVLAGFVLVLFTFFGVNYFMSGMHSYA